MLQSTGCIEDIFEEPLGKKALPRGMGKFCSRSLHCLRLRGYPTYHQLIGVHNCEAMWGNGLAGGYKEAGEGFVADRYFVYFQCECLKTIGLSEENVAEGSGGDEVLLHVAGLFTLERVPEKYRLYHEKPHVKKV